MEPNLVRIELDGPLAGHYVVVDANKLDVGLLEDMESGSVATIRAALTNVMTECDLPGETMRDKVRGIKPKAFTAFLAPILKAANEA